MKDMARTALARAAMENDWGHWQLAMSAASLCFGAAAVFIEAERLADAHDNNVIPLDHAIAAFPGPGPVPAALVAQRTQQLMPLHQSCALFWRTMRIIHGAQAAVDRIPGA